jgi:hypothetical protein
MHLLDCPPMHAVRAALAGLIDYAGLFPPASLDLRRVVENHMRYAESAENWLLGRLIVPITRLDELDERLQAFSTPASCTISTLAQIGDVHRVASRVAEFNERHTPRWAVVAVELAATTADDVERIAQCVPERYERYVELPLDDGLPTVLDAVATTGCYAKARTGGVVLDAFPEPAVLSRFMASCITREVPFKATAGLHHPLRGSYRLTYEPQSPSTVMHGFVNLVAAAGLLRAGLVDEHGAASLLETTDPHAIRFDEEGIGIGNHRLDIEACMTTRAHVLRSVGSCSFDDALADLRALRWIEGL